MTVSSHLTHVSGLKQNLPGFEEKSKQTASPILTITELAVWVPADPAVIRQRRQERKVL